MNKQELIERIKHLDEPYLKQEFILALIKQLDEPQPVKVPQFVADWIEEAKRTTYNIRGAIEMAQDVRVKDWLELKNVDIFAEAWVNGYEVEKEKRYFMKITAAEQYLVRVEDENFLGFLQSRLRSKFTRKQLEETGFGWVFDCPGIEIEEVE
jgi:hypothetical protein